MKQIAIFLQLFLLFSCSPKINKSIEIDSELQFQRFIKRQNIINLPTRIDLYKSDYNLVYPENTFSDTSIFHEYSTMGCLGILNDTTKFYYVIPMFPGDELCPILYVFNKKGNIIDKSSLYVGKYGPDCGSYVSGYTTINKDLKIFTQDSLARYHCDSAGNEFKDSLNIYTITKQMSILSSGKVKQEKEIEKILK